MAVAFIGIGTNLGNKKQSLRYTLARLSSLGRNLSCSHVYRTKPYGELNQPNFLNMAVRMTTELPPHELLTQLLRIEEELGRKRTVKWGPRTIDLDLLFYDDLVLSTETLVLPHPDLHNRVFVLQPLMDIDPDFVHPLLHKTIRELWESLTQEDYQRQEKAP
ncbi:MAG: 2-amino-4-hydroxy-6-hydroxymethyldihydropteridine diphosphokinase [Brevinematales bacterium]|nr:2-amino-4-hydroxy-6-hydroxymethyldihydropteridine diphosphokinase [Brevinematales bacterium]